MSPSSTLQLVNERGWRCGFANLLRKENGTWWGTYVWWTQALIWMAIINGMLAFVIWVVPVLAPAAALSAPNLTAGEKQAVQEDMADFQQNREANGLQVFFQVTGFTTAIGVMIIAQGAIVGEKQSGTAAWILSNPVSRTAVILSKFVALGIGSVAILIGLQSLIAYGQISLAGAGIWPVLPFLGSVGLLSLHLLFYLSLTLMLGTLFDSRGPVIGIPMAVLIGQSLLGSLVGSFVPWFPLLLPARLPELGLTLALGQPLPSPLPVVATTLLVVGFVLVAVWRFEREEF